MSWELKVIEDTHNHGLSAAPIAHPAHRIAALPPDVRAEIVYNWQAGMSNSMILSSLWIGFPRVILTRQDVANIIQVKRRHMLARRTPIKWLLEVCLI